MKVTIKDIAKKANVSRGTVDKVLHNRDGVSEEVRERVIRVTDELNYRTNIIGKALAQQKKPLTIPVIIPSSEFGNFIKKGVKKAQNEFKDFGIKIYYHLIKDFDADAQLKVLRDLKEKNISGLIIRPLKDTRIVNLINELAADDIPIVTYNSDIPECNRICFVGQNLLQSGRVAGDLMGKLLTGKGKVAIIIGSYNLPALIQRLEGFRQLINSRFPGIEIVDIIETFENKTLTFKKTINLLKRVRYLNGIYVTGGEAPEVGKAVKLMQKENEIKIISFDYYADIIKLVKEGVIDFTIGQDIFSQGYLPVKILFIYLFKRKLPDSDIIHTSIEIKSRENINTDNLLVY